MTVERLFIGKKEPTGHKPTEEALSTEKLSPLLLQGTDYKR